jgi:diguanylate cyclase (GGDEF)-like protein
MASLSSSSRRIVRKSQSALPPSAARAPNRPVGRYVVGLAAIAVLAIISSLAVGRALTRQESDARVVDAAAGQVTRSFQLEQAGVGLALSQDAADRRVYLAALESAADQLVRYHRGLSLGSDSLGLPGGNSARVTTMLESVESHLYAMLEAAGAIVGASEPVAQGAALNTWAELFRSEMESLVFQYEREAEDRVRNLEKVEIVLLEAMLVLLVIEGVFLFRPAVRQIRGGWRERERRHTAEREYDQVRLNYLAQFDPLTGLANRSLLWDRLDHAIVRARREGGVVTLMFIDLDDFKAVNDQHGHGTGDALLKSVAERLEGTVRESDTVARLGGDEFTVVLEGPHRPELAGIVAQKILEALADPFQINGREIFMTASIGIVVYPLDGDVVDDLVRDADIAMYAAKEAGRNNFQFFTRELRAQATERLNLIDSLRRALASGNQLRLVYQPKFDIGGERMVGVEALLRWEHPEFGLVPPTRFIPLAEETDLIIPLGGWVIEQACEQAARWRDEGLPELPVSINVSSRQFHYGDLVQTVEVALLRFGLDPGLVELELTEGTLIEDVELARRTLERLHDIGVRLSVDDFGTGYSSLGYLNQFPIDALKIDRSFIDGISDSPDSAAISTAIIRMGHSLRMEVIAEGVETTDQLDLLRELNCDVVQGFLTGRPGTPEEIKVLALGGGPDATGPTVEGAIPVL